MKFTASLLNRNCLEDDSKTICIIYVGLCLLGSTISIFNHRLRGTRAIYSMYCNTLRMYSDSASFQVNLVLCTYMASPLAFGYLFYMEIQYEYDEYTLDELPSNRHCAKLQMLCVYGDSRAMTRRAEETKKNHVPRIFL